MILETPFPDILKYLDAPVFPVGDLFYIQNLVSVIEARVITSDRCDLNADGVTNALDIQILANAILANSADSTKDINQDGQVNVLDLQLEANVVLGVAPCP